MIQTGEHHGDGEVCKTDLTGSTPALVSNFWPRLHCQVQYKIWGANSPHFDDMGKALFARYTQEGIVAMEYDSLSLLIRWLHLQFACKNNDYRDLSIENSKLRRENEKLKLKRFKAGEGK